MSRTELVSILGLDSPVGCSERFLDRRCDQIGDRKIPVFRQDLGDVGERFSQLIELIGGIGPVLLTPRETELDMAWLHERGHQIAERGRVLSVSRARCSECYDHRDRSDRLIRSVHGL